MGVLIYGRAKKAQENAMSVIGLSGFKRAQSPSV